jgi:CBS domain-containing protein
MLRGFTRGLPPGYIDIQGKMSIFKIPAVQSQGSRRIWTTTRRKGTAMMTIRELISNRSVYTVDSGATVQAAVEYMAHNNIGAVTVMDGSRLVGIFSERDVINRVIAKGLDPRSTVVASVMTSNLVVARSDETCESCLWKMKQANCRHLPIVEGDTLIGVISLRDLLLVDISEKDDKIEFLNTYMFHIPSGVERKKYSS